MPKQSTSQAIGHEGERWFAAQLPPKWIPQFPSTDVGVDLQVVICEDGPLNGLEFRVQVKSANRWTFQNDRIVVPGFSKASFVDLLGGLTFSLLVLYQASSKSGWCFWLNQLLASNPDLIRSVHKTITLKVPTNRPVDSNLWPMLGNELRGVTTALGRRIVMSGLSLPVLEATQSLMQSLHLIDLCTKANDLNVPLSKRPKAELDDLCVNGNPFSKFLDAEMTAHREIVTTLLDLNQVLKKLGSSILGVDQVAKQYIAICEKFLPGFSVYVRNRTTARVQFEVAPDIMAQHRSEAIRFVTQVVERLTMLTLQAARAVSENGG